MKNTIVLFFLAFCLLKASFPANAQEGDISELTLTKNFEGESIETTKKISISANHSRLNLVLDGKAKSGKITITLLKPNGLIFKIIEIDATSNVRFKLTLDLKTNPTDLIGDWQLKVQTDKAYGYYRLVIDSR